MAEDAARYFLVVFAAHFASVLALNLGRVSAAVLSLMNCIQRISIGRDTTPSSRVSNHRSSLNITTLIVFCFTAPSGLVV